MKDYAKIIAKHWLQETVFNRTLDEAYKHDVVVCVLKKLWRMLYASMFKAKIICFYWSMIFCSADLYFYIVVDLKQQQKKS